MTNPPDLETLNKLYLELSTIATARTWEQVVVRAEVDRARVVAINISMAMNQGNSSIARGWMDELIKLLADLKEKLNNPSMFRPNNL